MRGSGAAVLHAPARDRAAILGLRFGTRRRDAAEGSLDELAGLSAAAGAAISFRTLQERFIDRLADTLVAAFRATPEEVAERCGRVLRHEQQGGTVSMEVQGPADVVERWRRDGGGREPRCS